MQCKWKRKIGIAALVGGFGLIGYGYWSALVVSRRRWRKTQIQAYKELE